MPRYYRHNSAAAVLVRWTLVFGALYVLLSGVAWVFTDVLPALSPAAVVGGLVAAVSWLVG